MPLLWSIRFTGFVLVSVFIYFAFDILLLYVFDVLFVFAVISIVYYRWERSAIHTHEKGLEYVVAFINYISSSSTFHHFVTCCCLHFSTVGLYQLSETQQNGSTVRGSTDCLLYCLYALIMNNCLHALIMNNCLYALIVNNFIDVGNKINDGW